MDSSNLTSLKLLKLYIDRQASSPTKYLWEQAVINTLSWIPGLVGIGLRAMAYRLICSLDGAVAVERNVRLRFADQIRLAESVYLDESTYLHACPNGIHIGPRTRVMHGSILHVYNFRDLPNAGIWIGADSLIGEYNVIRGQGGVRIGDRVYTSPHTQVIAVNHVFDDPGRPFIEQGITAEGIVVEDDVWIGSGAILTDGVRVGKGAVVAAGAVVVDGVEPHTVVAGVPARVVRKIEGSGEVSEARQVYLAGWEAGQ